MNHGQPNYGIYEFLQVEISEGVALLTLNRPEQYNAISMPCHHELEKVWLDLAADERVRAIVITGAGKAFSSGGDLKAMIDRHGKEEGRLHALNCPGSTRRLWQNMLEVPQPIIAAVNGHAIGVGATLALMADISIIANEAKFGDTHTGVGMVAGDGGAVIWPLLIGPNKAKEYLMRGKLLSGIEAFELGLINHAHPKEHVLEEALDIAAELAAKPRYAVSWTKLSVNKWLKDQLNLILDASIAYEMLTTHTEDHLEAACSIMEKRAPNFTGR